MLLESRCEGLLATQGYRTSSSRLPLLPGRRGIEAVLRSPIVVPLLDAVGRGDPVEDTKDESERRLLSCGSRERDELDSWLPRRPSWRIEFPSGPLSWPAVEDTGELVEGTLDSERSEIGRLCSTNATCQVGQLTCSIREPLGRARLRTSIEPFELACLVRRGPAISGSSASDASELAPELALVERTRGSGVFWLLRRRKPGAFGSDAKRGPDPVGGLLSGGDSSARVGRKVSLKSQPTAASAITIGGEHVRSSFGIPNHNSVTFPSAGASCGHGRWCTPAVAGRGWFRSAALSSAGEVG